MRGSKPRNPPLPPLGRVHGQVGVTQQRLGLVARPGEREPDARPYGQLAPAQAERVEEGVTDTLGRALRLLDPGDVLEQHRELVATEPRDRVARAGAGAQALGDGDQQLIACRVAEGVVHPLEVVQVEEQHRDAALPPQGQGVPDTVAEQDAVGQVGQRVMEGAVVQLVLPDAQLGDRALQVAGEGEVLDQREQLAGDDQQGQPDAQGDQEPVQGATDAPTAAARTSGT